MPLSTRMVRLFVFALCVFSMSGCKTVSNSTSSPTDLDSQTDAITQYDLGVQYRRKGTPSDDKLAVEYLRRAAGQGYSNAQLDLGWMYTQGKGVEQDYAEAYKWYRKSADQGNVVAQTNIGNMYELGRGVSQDFAEAFKWYKKSS